MYIIFLPDAHFIVCFFTNVALIIIGLDLGCFLFLQILQDATAVSSIQAEFNIVENISDEKVFLSLFKT